MPPNEATLESFVANNSSILDELIGTDATELKNLLSNGAISGMQKSQILNQVTAASSASMQKTLLNTRLNTFSRVATNTMMKDAPVDTKYVYIGPIDEKTRDECLEYASAGALTEEKLTEFIGTLSLNAMQSEGNVYVVFAGTQARIDFHRAMKDLIVAQSGSHTGGSFLDVQEGRNIALGGNFTEYNALGNKIVVAHCPVFDDDTLHNSISSSFNTSNESGRMVFMDFGTSSGVSNVELISKGAEGYNRNFLKKYVSGMVNPYDQNSMLAASGDDFFEAHVLSESGIIVRNPLSCGVLSNA